MDSGSLPQTYKALMAQEDGLPRRLVELPLPKPGQNQMLIKMAFVPLNQTDLLCSQGFYRLSEKSPFPVGLEGSGVIVELGEGVPASYKVGDRVHVHGRGTLAQYHVEGPDGVFPMKDELTLEEGASHLVNPSMVAHLTALAVREGCKAVINTAASSALGKMLIRDLKEKGIKSINTVRDDKYIEELKKEGADYVLNSEAADFEAQLKEIAEKEGVTVAFDAINGDFTDKLIRNLPANSTVYVYGLLGGSKYGLFEEKQLEDGKSVKGLISYSYVMEWKERGELDKLYDELQSKLKTVYKSDIHKVCSLDEVLEAMEYYEKNSSKGKILIKPN